MGRGLGEQGRAAGSPAAKSRTVQGIAPPEFGWEVWLGPARPTACRHLLLRGQSRERRSRADLSRVFPHRQEVAHTYLGAERASLLSTPLPGTHIRQTLAPLCTLVATVLQMGGTNGPEGRGRGCSFSPHRSELLGVRKGRTVGCLGNPCPRGKPGPSQCQS